MTQTMVSLGEWLLEGRSPCSPDILPLLKTPARVLAMVYSIAGFIPFIVSAYFSNNVGYYGAVNDSYLALWPSLFILWTTLQLVILIRKRDKEGEDHREDPACCSVIRVCVLVPHAISLVAAFICFLGYAIGLRGDVAALYGLLTPLELAVVSSALFVLKSGSKSCDVESEVLNNNSGGRYSTLDANHRLGAKEENRPASLGEKVEKALILINYHFVAWIVLLFVILMCGGAVMHADRVAYPPTKTSGFLHNVGEAKYTIHYDCFGPANTTLPTLLLFSDASHGIGELWPIMRSLTDESRGGNRRRRVCAHDGPGFGLSSPVAPDFIYSKGRAKSYEYLEDYANKLSEQTPNNKGAFIPVGWGGGGEPSFHLATSPSTSDSVVGVVFQNVYFSGIEWREYAAVQGSGKTNEELLNYYHSSISGREVLFGALRSVGVGAGIMGVMVAGNASAFAWPERFHAAKYPFNRGMEWCTQYHALRGMVQDLGNAPYHTLGPFLNATARFPSLATLPLLVIPNNRSEETLCQQVASPPLSSTSQTCQNNVKSEKFLYNDAVNAARNVSNNVSVADCSDWSCSLALFQINPNLAAKFISRWLESNLL